MSTLEIKNRKGTIEVKVQYTFPTTVAQAISLYGEDVVHNRLLRQINQELRATVLRAAEAAKESNESIQDAAEDAVASFSPTVVTEAARAVKQASKALEGLTEEARNLVLKALAGAGANGTYTAESESSGSNDDMLASA